MSRLNITNAMQPGARCLAVAVMAGVPQVGCNDLARKKKHTDGTWLAQDRGRGAVVRGPGLTESCSCWGWVPRPGNAVVSCHCLADRAIGAACSAVP